MVESTSNDMLDDRKYYDIQGYHSWSTYKNSLYPWGREGIKTQKELRSNSVNFFALEFDLISRTGNGSI